VVGSCTAPDTGRGRVLEGGGAGVPRVLAVGAEPSASPDGAEPTAIPDGPGAVGHSPGMDGEAAEPPAAALAGFGDDAEPEAEDPAAPGAAPVGPAVGADPPDEAPAPPDGGADPWVAGWDAPGDDWDWRAER
jgi:hypothetical protein